MQTLLDAVYPPSCLTCGGLVAENGALCGPCWRETPFITGLGCDACGAPLSGDVQDGASLCDTCLTIARPWAKGRAALLYSGRARDLVLKLKHADRHDIAGPAAIWLARAAQGLIVPETLIVPVPLHWTRRLKRRYNQAGLLAAALGRTVNRPVCHDALVRTRRTPSLDGARREARFETLCGAIAPNPRRAGVLEGKPVLIVDDVMTSGATLAAATEAAHVAGAQQVCVPALARVAKPA
ncbi:double zinc ribbon domain-containing protein [Roseivivax sp. THAF197b]|uniref:double zinc ribbon domain-containing protein n=1 Tax=Roseivivax sp. THAF197b TaxID=2588299 RepID=UPI001267DA82|nr:double zinc ribbon domain-containing protein [Roseivivax sp. THAF197b]QFS84667.1 DNA utilization protein GntX [Roseivivax sp. THAF197b]